MRGAVNLESADAVLSEAVCPPAKGVNQQQASFDWLYKLDLQIVG